MIRLVDIVTEHVYGGQGGWQILEEHEQDIAPLALEPSATLARSYVYGNSIDEVLTFRDHDQNEFVDDLFLHGDDMHTVYAVTDEIVDQVLERYEYGDYGLPTVLSQDGITQRPESAFGNTRMFTGRLWGLTPVPLSPARTGTRI